MIVVGGLYRFEQGRRIATAADRRNQGIFVVLARMQLHSIQQRHRNHRRRLSLARECQFSVIKWRWHSRGQRHLMVWKMRTLFGCNTVLPDSTE
jgi:hypothetical protein